MTNAESKAQPKVQRPRRANANGAQRGGAAVAESKKLAAVAERKKAPPLSTSVVGSYAVPEWLERLKTDYYQRRISSDYIREIYEVAIKAESKTRSGPASTSSPTGSCAATTTSITSSPACPVSKSPSSARLFTP